MQHDDSGLVIAELANISFENETVEGVLEKVAQVALHAIPGCDHASVTLSGDGGLRSAATTDDVAEKIGAHEYDLSEGPCVACLASRQVEHLRSSEDTERWSAFAEMAAGFGVHSALGVPLGAEASGALDAYSDRPHAFDDRAIETARVIALYAGIAVKNAESFSRLGALVAQLNEALKTRETIGKAIGILMEREGRTEDEAFDLLRQVSQSSNVKLREIAEQIVRQKPSDS